MANLHLTVACGDYEIVRALKEGTVQAGGLDLTVLTDMGSREFNARMARRLEFDVCELGITTYAMTRDRGRPLTALPVYPHRRFRHGFVFVNTAAGIAQPRDLVGRRVGGNFQPASNAWVRGILEDRYGVDHRSVQWVGERSELERFTPPAGLQVEPARDDVALEELLLNGEVAALISPTIPKSFMAGDPRIARLFPDHRREEIAYFRDTGIFPIMHVLTIKEEIVERHPWVSTNLVKAFDTAKRLAMQRMVNPRLVPLAWYREAWEEQEAILGDDPWAYGFEGPNRANLETAFRYMHEQGLTSRAFTIDDAFAEGDYGNVGRQLIDEV